MKKLTALMISCMLLLGGCSLPVEGLLGGSESEQSASMGYVSSYFDSLESSESESKLPEKEPEDSQPEEEQPEGENPGENQPEGEKPGDSQPDEEQPEGENPGENQPEGEKPGESQPEEEQPEGENPEGNQPEGEQPGENPEDKPEDKPEDEPEEELPEDVPGDPECQHDYETTVVEPTCTKEGYTVYTCADCDSTYIADKVPYLGHAYQSVVTKPTCTTSGYTTYTCADCGDTYTANKTSYTGHSYKAVVVKPTCEEGGYTTYTCSTCGNVRVSDETAALNHSYNAVVTKPTCENGGYTTNTCGRCGDSYVSNTTAALGHSWLAATTEAPKTCKTCGKTEGDKLPSSTPLDTLYVHYIDVGQGDSILISVDNCDILIDAGVANMGKTVSNYLKAQKVDDIELMINTHPDADHCGGLTQVLNDFVVEEVWASPLTKDTKAYKNFAAAVKSEGLTMQNPATGTVFTYEALTLTLLYNGVGTKDANDSSLVVMVEYEELRFLFTGDISNTIENKLVNSNVDLSCDVLKVAHHGSATSSATAFLEATGAEYGVICVGTGNSYGHPTSDALKRLAEEGIEVYRTDLSGSIVFSTDGVNLYLPS